VILFSEYLNLCDHNPPTSQTGKRTDGRTDGQTHHNLTEIPRHAWTCFER